MITSRTKNENYVSYLIFEIIFVGVTMFIGVGLLVFYIAGRIETRSDSSPLQFLFDNPILYLVICLSPALISVGALLYFRSRNYIVGFNFDKESELVSLKYRGLMNRKLIDVSIPFLELKAKSFQERKIFSNLAFRGRTIAYGSEERPLDFVTNNFIWEKQPRERIHFLEELDRILEIQKNRGHEK